MAKKRFDDGNIEDSFISDLVGLPTRKKKAATPRTNIDATSFDAGGLGFSSSPEQKKAASEGIKGTGSALATEFRGLRPKPKKISAGLSTTSEQPEETASGGGLVTFQQGAKKQLPQAVANFGLPTDRLPSIEELGGALGGIAKFVSQLTKRNRARGLSPGTDTGKLKGTSATAGVGLAKAKAGILTKQLENATLSGDKEAAARISRRLDAFVAGDLAGAFDNQESDLEAIAGL